jgi:serine/threonine protein kinase
MNDSILIIWCRPCLRPDQWDVLTPLYKNFDLICSEGPRFGDMFKCKLRSTKEVVAVKILTIPEDHKSNGIPYSILNHVSILKALKHENIVKLIIFFPLFISFIINWCIWFCFISYIYIYCFCDIINITFIYVHSLMNDESLYNIYVCLLLCTDWKQW